MLRAVLFIVKIGILVALAVYIADRPGTVQIDWQDYHLKIHFGLFLLGILGFALLAIFVYAIIHTFISLPATLRRYNEIKNREKGYRALTLGLSAVAAGDKKDALKFANKTEKYLPDDTGLPLLLKAQAARLDGREEDARKSFALMLENKDAAFLGVRGLLQAAIDRREFAKALQLAQTALDTHPKQPWILKTVYNLQLKTSDWKSAQATLTRLKKIHAITPEKEKSDRAVLLLAQAEHDLETGYTTDALEKLKKSYHLDPSFIPAAVKLAEHYNQDGNRRAAVATIEKTWKTNPHPGLAALWGNLIPLKKRTNKTARLKWFEKLITLNSGSAESYIANAQETLNQHLWGQTREHLDRANTLHSSRKIFRLLSELEERSGGTADEIQNILRRMLDAPLDDAWVCRDTGHVYEEWHWSPPPHLLFNTLIWTVPENAAKILIDEHEQIPYTVLEAKI